MISVCKKLLVVRPLHKFCQIDEQLCSLQQTQKNQASIVLYVDFYQLANNENDRNDNSLSKYSRDDINRTNKICEKCIQGEIASVLPLAKAMGAKLIDHLNQEVSHILCDIVCESLKWHPLISLKTFQHYDRGYSLHQRLIALNLNSSIDVMLVSPGWVREKWR